MEEIKEFFDRKQHVDGLSLGDSQGFYCAHNARKGMIFYETETC